ncbi:DMT family transporter [Streptomyces sp. CMB-StM0423]|uniref:DMT family transporter n=1 Tax=Streptomyces sp. CMB-StM0423 TaxID=2059884 RepID=UPI002279476B|nr:DMT family transporter [Streptomyces sp. CMB-StM0423]
MRADGDSQGDIPFESRPAGNSATRNHEWSGGQSLAQDHPRGLLTRLTTPATMVIGGSACISLSAIFVKLSDVNAGTAAFLRCLLALLLLAPLAALELRRLGPRARRPVLTDLTAGLLLGVDFVFWAASIRDVGASIATVLLNIQVIVFPLLARLLTRTTLPRGFWLTAPVLLAGVALAGGAIGNPEPGSNPVTGILYGTAAGVAFAGYLFLTRLAGTHPRTPPHRSPAPHPAPHSPLRPGPPPTTPDPHPRSPGGPHPPTPHPTPTSPPAASSAPASASISPPAPAPASTPDSARTAGPAPTPSAPSRPRPHIAVPVCTATFSAAVASGVLGALWTGIDPTPEPAALGWLAALAALGQVLALLLITPALPRLAPATGAALLLLQPVLAIATAVTFLSERPTATQYAGCVLVIATVWYATRVAGRGAETPALRTEGRG